MTSFEILSPLLHYASNMKNDPSCIQIRNGSFDFISKKEHRSLKDDALLL